jgi:SulP family sulfate permease
MALWAVMVPEGMAYAGIVGVPPIMGLYTIIPPLIVYALLGTSRQLVVGPDTATGLISAVTVGAIVTQGTAEYNSLTSTLAGLVLPGPRDFAVGRAVRVMSRPVHRANTQCPITLRKLS